MRPIPKMLLWFALIILGSAIFFVVINDEDIGTPQQAPAQAPAAAGR